MKKLMLFVVAFLINSYSAPAKTIQGNITKTEYALTTEGNYVSIDWNSYVNRVTKAKEKIKNAIIRRSDFVTVPFPPGMEAKIEVEVFKDGTITTHLLKDDCFSFKNSVLEGLAWEQLQYADVLHFPKYTTYDSIKIIITLGNEQDALHWKNGYFGREIVQVDQ